MALSRLKILARPKASKDQLLGWQGDELKVKIAAMPKDGEANQALIRFLGKVLGVPRSAVHLLRGSGSTHKLLEINLEQEELIKRLDEKLRGGEVGGSKKPDSRGG